MLFLLDTNAFSDLMRQHAGVSAKLDALPPGNDVITCAIVRGEIRHGIERLPQGRKRVEFERQSAPLFATVLCRPVPAAAGDYYATTKLACTRKGVALNENDLWI